MFALFDSDGSGRISLRELKRVVAELGGCGAARCYALGCIEINPELFITHNSETLRRFFLSLQART